VPPDQTDRLDRVGWIGIRGGCLKHPIRSLFLYRGMIASGLRLTEGPELNGDTATWIGSVERDESRGSMATQQRRDGLTARVEDSREFVHGLGTVAQSVGHGIGESLRTCGRVASSAVRDGAVGFLPLIARRARGGEVVEIIGAAVAQGDAVIHFERDVRGVLTAVLTGKSVSFEHGPADRIPGGRREAARLCRHGPIIPEQ
jgi:hypothetical protein